MKIDVITDLARSIAVWPIAAVGWPIFSYIALRKQRKELAKQAESEPRYVAPRINVAVPVNLEVNDRN